MRVKLQEALGTSSLIMADASLQDVFYVTIGWCYLSRGCCRTRFRQDTGMEAGLKVLVVCNTVEQAQMVYRNLYAESQLLIHGSFNAEDRSRKEVRLREEQVQAFWLERKLLRSVWILTMIIYTEPAPLVVVHHVLVV